MLIGNGNRYGCTIKDKTAIASFGVGSSVGKRGQRGQQAGSRYIGQQGIFLKPLPVELVNFLSTGRSGQTNASIPEIGRGEPMAKTVFKKDGIRALRFPKSSQVQL